MSNRFTWPWGRISPEKRLEELDRIIQRHEATIRILKSQAQEAVRLHEKSIQAIMEQKEIVAGFIDEARRKETMAEAYDIEAQGIPVLDDLSNAKTLEEIDEIIRVGREKLSLKSLDTGSASPKSDIQEGLDIFEDLENNIGEIFGKDE